jgi:resuscitation-promoting factor RpfA
MKICRLSAIAAADAAALVMLRPDAIQLARYLTAPTETVRRVGADAAAAEIAQAALWCIAVWVAVGLAACAASALPGACGHLADRFARHVLPATVYRLMAGAAGLGVLLSPAAAGACPHPAPTASTPAPQWPSDTPLPAPAWPATPVHRSAARPAAPVAPAPAPIPRARTVLVQPGDTLWSIAADHLPAGAGPGRVARAWPRWFATNRAVVGADPDLIRPGEVLHAPSPQQDHRP